MRNIAVSGYIIIIFLMMLTPNVIAIEYDFFEPKIENKFESMGPIVTVKGGLGIKIDVYNVDDETAFNVMINGALMIYKRVSATIFNHFNVYLLTLNFLFDSFIMHINIGNQIWSYDCYSFFCFVIDITPVHIE
jgi:hypothetical protein